MKTNAKSFLVQRQQRNELWRMQAGFRLIGLIGRRLSLDVVRTDLLTDIAAENMIADQRSQVARYETFELNRQVRNAAPCIEHVGPDKCAGRAGLETEIAFAASVA